MSFLVGELTEVLLAEGWPEVFLGYEPFGEDVAVGAEKLKLRLEVSLAGEERESNGFDESKISVSNNEVEKLGSPHWTHSHETFLNLQTRRDGGGGC